MPAVKTQAMPKAYYQIILRVADAEVIERITLAAQAAGVSRNQYIATAALEKAEREEVR